MTQIRCNRPAPGVEVAGMTDRGLVRPSNEDSFLVLTGQTLPWWCYLLAGVFDGLGGLPHGEVASSRAAQYLKELLIAPSSADSLIEGPKRLLERIMQDIHMRLKADRQGELALRGMATTATIALLPSAAPTTLWIAHVGDSPVFRVRDGQMDKLVQEDSLMAALQQAGDCASRHVVTQALGYGERVTPHVGAHKVKPGDGFLLCTDGLTNMVREDDILKILMAQPPEVACQQLINAANAAGGIDNITVVVIKSCFIQVTDEFSEDSAQGRLLPSDS